MEMGNKFSIFQKYKVFTHTVSTLNGEMTVFVSWAELQLITEKNVCKERPTWTSWPGTIPAIRVVTRYKNITLYKLKNWKWVAYTVKVPYLATESYRLPITVYG